MRITYALPNTHFEPASAAELRQLARIVWQAYPDLPPVSEAEFAAAFTALGYQYRLAQPETKFLFHTHVDHCCDFLAAHSLGGEVAGASVFGAMLAHGDIPGAPTIRASGSCSRSGSMFIPAGRAAFPMPGAMSSQRGSC